MELRFTAPCLFGLEGPVANELRRLGMKDVSAENGRVSFTGKEIDIARANISLRFAERVLIELGEFDALSFDDLFEGTKALEWERFIPKNGVFPVKGHCLDSKLHSVPDCQRIIKKAVADRLAAKYGVSWMQEDAETYQITFSIMKDSACLYLDTSGAGLHKRGYRAKGGIAPLRETLAAAMVDLARYRGRDAFRDPFCGSGTIPIEAALIAKNRAPGLRRGFAAYQWRTVDTEIWSTAREEAKAREFHGDYDIAGSDIDETALSQARLNAEQAGVSDVVRFERRDAADFDGQTGRGIIVTNPPYGERLMEKREAADLYRRFGETVRGLQNWSVHILSPHPEFEREFGRQADKKRKLYNGMIKCDYFFYYRKETLSKQ